MTFWTPEVQPAGAGESEPGSGGTPSDPKRGDGETVFTKTQLDAAVSKAVNAVVGKERAQAERRAAEAAEAALQSFREEHGLDDAALDKVKGTRSELDKLRAELAKATRILETKDKTLAELTKATDEYRAKDRQRVINDVLDKGIRSFSRKTGHRVIEDAKGDVLAAIRPRLRADDDGSITVLGDDGNPLHGMDVGDWLADELGRRKWALEPTTTGGAGSRPGGKGPAESRKLDLGSSEGMGALFGNPGLADPNLARKR
jgi:hypothetical protein